MLFLIKGISTHEDNLKIWKSTNHFKAIIFHKAMANYYFSVLSVNSELFKTQMWPSPFCLKIFHSSPIPIGSSPNSSVQPCFPICPVLTESYRAFYQHGRFLPILARDSHSLAHTYLCLYLSRPSSEVILPINGLWFLTELVHPSTSTHPHPCTTGASACSHDMANQLNTV